MKDPQNLFELMRVSVVLVLVLSMSLVVVDRFKRFLCSALALTASLATLPAVLGLFGVQRRLWPWPWQWDVPVMWYGMFAQAVLCLGVVGAVLLSSKRDMRSYTVTAALVATFLGVWNGVIFLYLQTQLP